MVTALDGIERIPIFFLVFLNQYPGLSSASQPSMRHHFLDLGGPCVVFCSETRIFVIGPFWTFRAGLEKYIQYRHGFLRAICGRVHPRKCPRSVLWWKNNTLPVGILGDTVPLHCIDAARRCQSCIILSVALSHRSPGKGSSQDLKLKKNKSVYGLSLAYTSWHDNYGTAYSTKDCNISQRLQNGIVKDDQEYKKRESITRNALIQTTFKHIERKRCYPKLE
jgi:hypothetical protein